MITTICPLCESGEVSQLSKTEFKCNHCKEWFEVSKKKEEPKPEISHKEGIDWDLVEEQMQINTKDRYNWKELFGMSLTRYIAQMKAHGFDAEGAYKEICNVYMINDELKRRLKIGVAARYGEMATAQSELNKRILNNGGNKNG